MFLILIPNRIVHMLFIAILFLAAAILPSLDAMERDNDVQKCTSAESSINYIAQNCSDPSLLTVAIQQVYKAYARDVDSSVDIVMMELKKANISLLDIKNQWHENVLLYATNYEYTEIVEIILPLAKKLDCLEAFMCARNHNDETALHLAAYRINTKIFTHLLIFATLIEKNKALEFVCASDRYKNNVTHKIAVNRNVEMMETFLEFVDQRCPGRAWELVNLKNSMGFTAYKLGSDKIRQIMDKYRPE